jgi:hypothetical protein
MMLAAYPGLNTEAWLAASAHLKHQQVPHSAGSAVLRVSAGVDDAGGAHKRCARCDEYHAQPVVAMQPALEDDNGQQPRKDDQRAAQHLEHRRIPAVGGEQWQHQVMLQQLCCSRSKSAQHAAGMRQART